MGRNDRVLIFALVGTFFAVVLVAFAPPISSSDEIARRAWALANSSFFVALITAFAGAFAGALGAQAISERNSKRKSLLAEIRETNAAISICFDLVNAYLAFKKQIVRDVCERYQQTQMLRTQFGESLRTDAVPPGSQPNVQLDLRSFDAPFAPVIALQRALQEKIIPEGPSLAFLTLLTQGIVTLNGAVSARNELINIMRQTPRERIFDVYAIYFGTGLGDGITDGGYPAQMHILAQATDDCIGIAIVLSELLRKHGKKVAQQYGADAPKIAKVDWDIAEKGKLVPDLSRYEGWLKTSFGQMSY